MFRNSKNTLSLVENTMLNRVQGTEPNYASEMNIREVYQLQERMMKAEGEIATLVQMLQEVQYAGDTKSIHQAEYKKLEAQILTVIMDIARGVFGK